MKFIVESIHVKSDVLFKGIDYTEMIDISRTYSIIIPKSCSTVTIECFEGENVIDKISTMFNIDISEIEFEDFTNN